MAISNAMQSAGLRLIGRKPSVFFSSTGQFEQEMVDLVNEVAKDCIASEEWQALINVYNLPADGTKEDFDFPADYDRQLLNTDIQDLDNWVWGYEHITDMNEFIYRRARGFDLIPGSWIIYGDQFHFFPAPPASTTASFPYVSNYYAVGADSVAKPEFTADTDTFVLPERLLTLGLIWRWRENKKLDYTGDMEAFQKCIEELSSRDKGSQIIRRGRSWRGLNTTTAYPWSLP